MKLRTIIAEDEELARESVCDLVGADPRLELVGIASTGTDGLRLLDTLAPDLAFLDVQMPGLTGLDVLARAKHEPAVIFTTAHANYATDAFELGAVDYLLKPFGRERFTAAVDRLIRRMGPRSEQSAQAPSEPLERLFVRHKSMIVPVRMADVSRLEAQDDYVLLHAPGGPFWVSVPLSTLEEKLDPRRFLRIHRSHIVSLDHIQALETHDARRLLVVMRDGAMIVASRQSSQQLRAAIA